MSRILIALKYVDYTGEDDKKRNMIPGCPATPSGYLGSSKCKGKFSL
jgi:hypothetical protein